MQNVIIDTNLWYIYVGLATAQNDKITPSQLLQKTSDFKMYVTTATIVEMCVKFRSNIPSIKRLLDPVMNGLMGVVATPVLALQQTDIHTLYAGDVNLIDKLFNNKQEIESSLGFLFIVFVTTGLFEYLTKHHYNITDKSKLNQLQHSMYSLFKSNEEFITSDLLKNISYGYAQADEDREFKKSYHKFVRLVLRTWLSFFYIFDIDSIDEECNSKISTKDMIVLLTDRTKNDPIFKKTSDETYNPFVLMRKKPQTITIVNSLINQLSTLNEITKPVRDYIRHKINKIYNEGAVLKKNDIVDMIIMYTINLEDFLFATLDAKLQSALQEIHPKSYELCKLWGLVK